MATPGCSGKPLKAKLGIKPGMAVAVVAPPRAYETILGEPLDPPAAVCVKPSGVRKGACDLVHLFCPDYAALAKGGARALEGLREGGALWVSWPKKSSKLFADLTEDGVREVLLPTGWVDVKVCAVDADWSGLKFLRRRG